MNFLGELFAMLDFIGIDVDELMDTAAKSVKNHRTRTKHKCRKHGKIKHVWVTKNNYY